MANILCVTSGLRGILYSSLELTRRLCAAGHEVTYASVPAVRDTVGDHGAAFVALPTSSYQDFLADDAETPTLARLTSTKKRRSQALASWNLDRFVETIRDTEADLVLIDGEMHEQIIAASATGVPLLLLNSFVSIWRHPGLPPAHRLVRPGVGWRGSRIGIELLWLELRLRSFFRSKRLYLRRLGCDRISTLRLLAEKSGFDFRRETDFGQWLRPFTYKHIPVLSLHAQELDFPHTPSRRVHHVGPMVAEQRVDERSARSRDELAPVLEERRTNPSSRLIYAGFGSFFTAEGEMLRRLCTAVAARRDWRLILAIGRDDLKLEVGELPENVFVFGWVDQLEALQHADVAVVHGGTNTAEECVLTHTPMLVYCGYETDMAGTAARIEHHDLGIVGHRDDDPETICRHLERLLTEQQFVDNTRRHADLYRRYEERQILERTVSSYLSQSTRSKPNSP